jgi:hypothetical protein
MNKFLKKKGFVKMWLADKSGFWWEKYFPHPYLKDLKVCVDDIWLGGSVFIDTDEVNTEGKYAGVQYTVYRLHLTKKNVKKVLKLVREEHL